MDYVKTVMNKPLEIQDIVSIHYFEYAKDFTYSGEFHDFWELVYADKEELLITAGAHELTLTAGQLYLHRPMEFHNLRCNGEKAANSFIISFSSPSPQLFSIAGKIHRCPQKCKKIMATIIKETKNAFSSPLGAPHTAQLIRSEEAVFGAEQLIQLYLEELLIRLIREIGSSAQNDEPASIEEVDNSKLAEICKYLENNVENRLTFNDLCNHYSMSESTLKKMFREGIGYGAMDYYNRCKIDRAKQMIREKDKNFTEIADRLGYNSVQYFSRHFKQSTGMTPSQYAASIENMF
ncbi:MAG: helix-turn-helix transcriptional regulator [Clostridia bacterium]|nr:helix-turn-helix transcriptional regulator [Clostridia bacterium]